ncbi:MAG TPA: OmpA family protein, partial [Thermoanaerobaculia bacterium]|nr:OmpA family protein [Thermoanaerobaculia bacterium]
MNKAVKGFVLGLVLVALALVPACRSKKPPAPKVVPTETSASAPNIPAVETTATTSTETRVANPPDFVQPQPTVTVEPLPTDIEQLNRVAAERGLIRDAFFNFDDSTLSADAQSALQASATWLKQNPQYNLALGDRRAQTAKDYLAALGVDASRIRTVSYGEERPFDPGHDESAWAKNRRDHLVLVA